MNRSRRQSLRAAENARRFKKLFARPNSCRVCKASARKLADGMCEACQLRDAIAKAQA